MKTGSLRPALATLAILAGTVSGSWSFSADRNHAVAGIPVDLYALNTGPQTGTMLRSISLRYVGSPIRFAWDDEAGEVAIPAGDAQTSWLRVGNRGNTFIVGSELRIEDTPASIGDRRWSAPVTDFQVTMTFQSAPAPATAAVNGGRGAHFARFFPPTPDGPLSFAIFSPPNTGIAGDIGPVVPFDTRPHDFSYAPRFVDGPERLVIDFGRRAFVNIDLVVTASDFDAHDVVTISADTLPDSLSGLSYTSVPGNPASWHLTGRLDRSPVPFGTVIPIGLVAADQSPLSDDATRVLELWIIPEPSTLAVTLVLAALGLRRRRR